MTILRAVEEWQEPDLEITRDMRPFAKGERVRVIRGSKRGVVGVLWQQWGAPEFGLWWVSNGSACELVAEEDLHHEPKRRIGLTLIWAAVCAVCAIVAGIVVYLVQSAVAYVSR